MVGLGRGARLTLPIIGTATALISMACDQQEQEPRTPAPGTPPAIHERQKPPVLSGSDTFAAPNPGAEAVSYNPTLAPEGAAILAVVMPASYGYPRTVATLSVAGVAAQPRLCRARAHQGLRHHRRGRRAALLKPHRPRRDTRSALDQSRIRNPRNEIWLDLRTDSDSSASSGTTVPFSFTDRTPASIVVHEAQTTATHPGHAGQAGARIACLTLSRE